MLAVMENSQELMRSRWIKDYQPKFHKPEDYMPDFLKPRSEIVNLDEARQSAAQAASGKKPTPTPPPDVVNKKWAALVAMKTARAQKVKATGKGKKAG